MKKFTATKEILTDILYAIVAGIIVGTAYHFFQNSNGFAPGGVGGLATITYHLFSDRVSWSVLMLAFNLPIFVSVSAVVNKKLGLILSIYMLVQSFIPYFYNWLGASPYCLANNQDDFNIIFACIAAGVVSGSSPQATMPKAMVRASISRNTRIIVFFILFSSILCLFIRCGHAAGTGSY